jgi:hypothetical protein
MAKKKEVPEVKEVEAVEEKLHDEVRFLGITFPTDVYGKTKKLRQAFSELGTIEKEEDEAMVLETISQAVQWIKNRAENNRQTFEVRVKQREKRAERAAAHTAKKREESRKADLKRAQDEVKRLEKSAK